MNDHQYSQQQHSWAQDEKGEYVHISKASSGKNGYFCIGCKREMIAVVNFKDPSHKKYFRHDVVSEPNKKCTYSDETTRHKIAKDILQQLKEIKVPAVYVFPPVETAGKPNLIKKERIIKAYSVLIERCFYEDDNGQIKSSNKAEAKEKGINYLIRPDVTFLNSDGVPILFIELVAKHKVTDEKKIKIKRLGIDTIQVRLPEDSQEEIERTFKVIERTKWIYNYEQESTQYIPIPTADRETVSFVDEVQGKLLEETFSCRAAEIRNLLFAINKCLESELYRTIEYNFRQEISRIENDSREEQHRAETIQGRISQETEFEFASENEKLETEERTIENQEREFQEHSRKLEERYSRKREDMEREEASFRERIKSKFGEEGYGGDSFERRKIQLEGERESIEFAFEKEKSAVENLEIEIQNLPRRAKQQEDEYGREIEELETRETKSCSDIRNRISELPTKFDNLRTGIKARMEEQIREDVERVKNRNGSGDTELSRELKRILEIWGLLNNYEELFRVARRYRQAYDCFKEGYYKNWDEFRRILPMDGTK
jgi:hypothetical protein